MEQIFKVTTNDTAAHLLSGTLEVLATPKVVAMVENTCLKECATQLTEGQTTVGVQMTIDHLLPSGVGATIKVVTTLEKTGKKSFSFSFVVYEGEKCIARGQHVRVKVTAETFMETLEKNR
ncbi:thioesterase family protein [Enterococcus timonensis]|uniref:thioesterase family protein n=1 Tax=Enterococcus timonensis TaxID=1852364 RepID=UPI0008DAFA51|nr:hotdog domain-containing protein [Enterococcus timonensis]